jgi:hypothetical protein
MTTGNALPTAPQRPTTDSAPCAKATSSALGSFLRTLSFADYAAGLLVIVYVYFFLWGASKSAVGIAPFWFNPLWLTDDSLQQTYPFWRAVDPTAFENDFVTSMMINYIPPGHYWLGYAITLLTRDPIMTGHWLMLVQLMATVGFIFGAVRALTKSYAPALFAVTWFLHTRHVVQRITAGLPRGWAAPIIAAFLYFAAKQNHRGILATIAVACVIHPPSTVAICLAYGLYLLVQVCRPSTRALYKRPFLELVVLGPIFVAVTAWSVAKPAEFGSMTTYEQALQRPEFSANEPKGRFPFVPFKPMSQEVSSFAFQAFTTPRLYRSASIMRAYTPVIVATLALILLVAGARRRTLVFPGLFIAYGLASALVYIASRILAFKLFVPDRHLQFPFALLCIVGFSAAIWRVATGPMQRATQSSGRSISRAGLSRGVIGLIGVAVIIFAGSGTGLYGAANFNYDRYRRGRVFDWVRANTPLDAVIAGEPIYIDPVQLFAERKGFITSETAHPFYTGYWQEARRRLEISLRANYALTIEDFLTHVGSEKISYFIFDRHSLFGDRLAKVKYYAPFNGLIRELARHAPSEYLGRKLLSMPKDVSASFLRYVDDRAIVVDVEALKRYQASVSAQP